MKKLSLLVLFVLIFSAVCFANSEDGKILMGGNLIATIKWANNMSIEARTDIVQARVVNMLNSGKNIPNMFARNSKDGTCSIYYVANDKENLIITLFPQDAKSHGIKINVLANDWIQAMRANYLDAIPKVEPTVMEDNVNIE